MVLNGMMSWESWQRPRTARWTRTMQGPVGRLREAEAAMRAAAAGMTMNALSKRAPNILRPTATAMSEPSAFHAQRSAQARGSWSSREVLAAILYRRRIPFWPKVTSDEPCGCHVTLPLPLRWAGSSMTSFFVRSKSCGEPVLVTMPLGKEIF